MIFNASSSEGGELSFLNNTVAAYKDMLDLGRGNLTTIAWEWKQNYIYSIAVTIVINDNFMKYQNTRVEGYERGRSVGLFRFSRET